MRASDKVKVAVAVPANSKKPLSFNQLTTSGFFQVQPIMYHHMIAKESIKGQANIFSRSNPLVTPAMTDIYFNFHKFFVRWKDVWPAWDDYKQQSLHVFGANGATSVIPKKPYILEKDLVDLITVTHLNDFVASCTSSDPYDIAVLQTDNSLLYFKFQNAGVYAYKLLLSLGYRISWDLNSNREINILPLLAYGKIYLDWFYPNMYLNSSLWMTYIQSAFVYDYKTVQAGYANQQNNIYAVAIYHILKNCTFATFDDNDLYSAWDTPSAPSLNTMGAVRVTDITNDYPFSTTVGASNSVEEVSVDNWHNSNGTPSLSSTINNSGTNVNYSWVARLNQYMLDSLHKVTNLVRRAQLVGARSVDRFLSRYGIKLQDDHRSMLLGSEKLFLNIGDVESNSDSSNGTTSSNVGDLAGKGVSLGSFDYDCSSASHEGIFMILMVPRCTSSLVQGMDQLNLDVNVHDDYTPEFDHLGTSAVPKCAVYSSNKGDDNVDPNGVFGYLPRYWQYATNRDLMTGAFAMPSLGASDLTSYHTYRLFSGSDQNFVHSPSFMFPTFVDNALLNRVFYDLTNSEQLIVKFNSRFVSDSPKRPLKDVYDWGSDDDKNGTVDLQSTGSKLS